MDLSETFNENKEKLAALAALAVMAGTAVASKKVPVHGLETVLSAFGKEGKLVRNVAKSMVERKIKPTSITGRNFIARELANVGGRTSSPILRSTKIIKNRLVKQEDGFRREIADTLAPSAAVRRLNTALDVPKFDPKTGEQKFIDLLGSNRITNMDLNDPSIAEAALLNLTGDSAKNYELQTRIANLVAKKSMPGNFVTKQLNFIKDFRGNQMKVREDLIASLKEDAMVLSDRTGISFDDAFKRVSNAFASVSPKKSLANNKIMYDDVLDVNELGATRIKTGSGRFNKKTGKEIPDPLLQQKNRALQALRGNFSGDQATNLSKVEQMGAALAGKNSTVLDTAELEKLLVGFSGKERSQIINALYNRGRGNLTYSALNDAIDQVVSSGHLRNVARVMTGSKDKALNRFLYQGGLERRADLERLK